MSSLGGSRVALLEAHLSDEAAEHVRRFGGIPLIVPAVREAPHVERVPPFLDALSSGRITVVLFLTGVGATILLREASRLGRLEETLEALRRTTVACRGPKPVAVLERHSVTVHLTAASPYTTQELLEALTAIHLGGTVVGIVHHAERSQALASALAALGAQLEEISIYEWALSADLEPLRTLVRDLIGGRVDAIAFTNRIQSRHLFRVAEDLGLAGALTAALGGDVIVAAVGPVCADALHSLGVVPDVIPARPNMEAMIEALSEYVELTEGLI